MKVAVTGGSGTFGGYLLPALTAAGHEPIVISRSERSRPDGIPVRVADVRTGEGLASAIQDADAVVHAATNPARPKQTEVDGSFHVVSAAGDRFVFYLSIVGVDRHRFPYYKAKWEGEKIVATAPNHSIMRATQFHDLLDWWLGLPAFFTTPGMGFQLIDAAVVAQRTARSLADGPAGRLPDIGGPRVYPMSDLAQTRSAFAKTARLIRVPRVGFAADFDAGRHTNLQAAVSEGRTWQEFLDDEYGA